MDLLSNVCLACGQTRKKKDAIMYTAEGLEPYCAHPHTCNEEHPNALERIAARGSVARFLDAETAKKYFAQRLSAKYKNPKTVERINRLITAPSTVRIIEVDLAEYIVALMEANEFETIADAIRFCVRESKDLHPEIAYTEEPTVDHIIESLKPEAKEEPIAEPVAEVVKETVPEKVTVPEEQAKEEPVAEESGEWDF